MYNQTAQRSRKYLYAVVAGGLETSYDALGINDSPVYSIPDRRVSAVVSDVSYERIRPERRYLAVHQRVLRRLMEETTPLPMSFGMIADGSNEIRKILSLNQEGFYEQLRRVEGKQEMGLRVVWDVENIFEFFVNVHPELRAARDRLREGQRAPTQEDKIELGRLFERTLDADRETYARRVEEIFSRHCREIKRNKCRNEHEVMNLACLVGRESGPEFEAIVLEAAKLFDNDFSFDYNGPWAPHNFIDLNLKL